MAVIPSKLIFDRDSGCPTSLAKLPGMKNIQNPSPRDLLGIGLNPKLFPSEKLFYWLVRPRNPVLASNDPLASILATLRLPALSQGKRQGQRASCKNHPKQIWLGRGYNRVMKVDSISQMNAPPKKRPLTFGDFVAGVYRNWGKRRAKGIVQLAIKVHMIEFRGTERFVIS
jgi:hypothetical protein